MKRLVMALTILIKQRQCGVSLQESLVNVAFLRQNKFIKTDAYN